MSAPVRIERIAAGGDGVGRLADGRAVFVPRAAPGDEVELEDVRLHRTYARARLGRLLTPGPGRVTPRCAHYDGDQCGACQLQHLSLEAQRSARQAIVRDALARIGGVTVADVPLAAAAPAWGYRHRITLHADPARRRLGFHPVGDARAAFDLVRCEIAAGPLNALWAGIRATREALPAALEAVVLRLGRDGRRHVVLRGPVRPTPEGLARLSGCATEGGPVSWWWEAGSALRPLTGEGESPASASAFEQVNPAAGDAVRDFALGLLGDLSGRHAWDLYAGTGDATRALRAAGATVESVERDAAAVAQADREGPAEGVRRHAGAVEAWVGRLRRPDVVFTNPPRAGMAPEVVAALQAARPGVLVYVSCDPATLARDLRRLGPGFGASRVQAFDLFPQTAHVETVVRLEGR